MSREMRKNLNEGKVKHKLGYLLIEIKIIELEGMIKIFSQYLQYVCI